MSSPGELCAVVAASSGSTGGSSESGELPATSSAARESTSSPRSWRPRSRALPRARPRADRRPGGRGVRAPDRVGADTSLVDQKTELQEELARRGRRSSTSCSRRRARRTTGPSRARRSWTASRSAPARGRTKKDAEQAAAAEALAAARAASASTRRVGWQQVRPQRQLACPARAPERDQAAWLQVVPRSGGDPARAGRGRGRRAERLGQVERRRRDRLGGRLPRAARAARGEARRRALRRARPAARPTDYCEVELAVRQRGRRRAGRRSRRSRSRGGCTAAARASTSSTAPPSRRIDLVELLADVGLGGGMHSIIGQGSVEEMLVVVARASAARCIEEAAGLGRFKRRRHRAELKLARVAIQVERARDLEGEVQKRLRPLALQATAAERAEKLGGEIASLARARSRSSTSRRSASARGEGEAGARPRRSRAAHVERAARGAARRARTAPRRS